MPRYLWLFWEPPTIPTPKRLFNEKSQKTEDWLGSHERAFEFFGGVPEIVVPDNPKCAVIKACRYEPDLNPAYQHLACHYQVAVIPARPYKPKDKAKAEVGVQVVERWILARLRHEMFFTLAELNLRIRELLTELNLKPFKQLPGTRRRLSESSASSNQRTVDSDRFTTMLYQFLYWLGTQDHKSEWCWLVSRPTTKLTGEAAAIDPGYYQTPPPLPAVEALLQTAGTEVEINPSRLRPVLKKTEGVFLTSKHMENLFREFLQYFRDTASWEKMTD